MCWGPWGPWPWRSSIRCPTHKIFKAACCTSVWTGEASSEPPGRWWSWSLTQGVYVASQPAHLTPGPNLVASSLSSIFYTLGFQNT